MDKGRKRKWNEMESVRKGKSVKKVKIRRKRMGKVKEGKSLKMHGRN